MESIQITWLNLTQPHGFYEHGVPSFGPSEEETSHVEHIYGGGSNVSEIGSALGSALLTKDADFIETMRQITPEDRQAMVDIVRWNFDRAKKVAPQLERFFTDAEAEFMDAVHR